MYPKLEINASVWSSPRDLLASRILIALRVQDHMLPLWRELNTGIGQAVQESSPPPSANLIRAQNPKSPLISTFYPTNSDLDDRLTSASDSQPRNTEAIGVHMEGQRV